MIDAPPDDVLTLDQVAAMLKVSRRTVERMDIPFARCGRLRRYVKTQVLAYLEGKAK